jgi:predicted nucleic acid-binding protein
LSASEFLDTNILVYAFTTDPRSEAAVVLLAKGCTISVQGLNEFANIARRKLGMSWDETGQALEAIRTLCARIEPSTLQVHERAMALAAKHRFSVFDAAMLATALEAGCESFWSEDLQHGMQVEATMTIFNPFLAG